MLFEIEVSGRTRRVTVERLRDEAHRFKVTVDGVEHAVDAVRLGDGQWSLLEGAPAPASRSVRVDAAADGTLVVHVGSRAISTVIDGARVRRGRDASGPGGVQTITAPMPGKVLRVLVEPGQTVSARQPLVVVEAMKMENEMSAPRDGRVRNVHVTEGMSVEAGRLLVVIE